jgi:hypothetical protein
MIPKLTKEQKIEAGLWRIGKCGSTSFKKLFKKFKEGVEKKWKRKKKELI